MRKPITTILAGLIALFAFTPSADASPSVPASGKRPAVRSVCETGFRGQPAYDAKCLRTGTVLDGVNLWFRGADGKVIKAADRRAFCRDANSAKTTRAGIIDGLFDVAYDRYRNHKHVLNVAATVGVLDCAELGVKIKK